MLRGTGALRDVPFVTGLRVTVLSFTQMRTCLPSLRRVSRHHASSVALSFNEYNLVNYMYMYFKNVFFLKTFFIKQ